MVAEYNFGLCLLSSTEVASRAGSQIKHLVIGFVSSTSVTFGAGRARWPPNKRPGIDSRAFTRENHVHVQVAPPTKPKLPIIVCWDDRGIAMTWYGP